MNWRKIKAEYLAGGVSQRALADKYGIAWGTFSKRTRKEKWTAARKQAEEKEVEKVSQRTAEIVADNATLLERAKRGLLMRVVDMIENYPDISAAEFKRKENGGESKYSLKDLAAVLSAVEDKAAKGQSADIEDLAPLGELLKGE